MIPAPDDALAQLRQLAGDATSQAILRVDAALTLSTRAALVGFHRQEIEAAGRWPAALDLVVGEATVLVG